MTLTHDARWALGAAAALVNAAQDSADRPATSAEALAFAVAWGTRDDHLHPPAAASLTRIRRQLQDVWDCSGAQRLHAVNSMLSGVSLRPVLVTHDEWELHLHACAVDAPLIDRVAAEGALALAALASTHELDRLRICAAEHCNSAFVDLSKNRSRRFCRLGCSNRVSAAKYRARRRA